MMGTKSFFQWPVARASWALMILWMRELKASFILAPCPQLHRENVFTLHPSKAQPYSSTSMAPAVMPEVGDPLS